MKKSQKILSILIVLSLVLIMVPATVFAADTHKVAIHMQQYGMGFANEQGIVSNQYYIVESDGSLNSDGADENNYNIYYDEASAQLTINDLQISSIKSLLVPGGTTIEVLGTNRIERIETESFGGGIGVVSNGDLTITGSGSLYLSSKSYSGISWVTQNNDYDGAAQTGNLQIIGDVDLTIDHMGATTCINTGGGDVVIGGNAAVHLDPRKGNDNTFSMAFFTGESITVRDNAKVTSTAPIDTFGTDSSGEYGTIDLLGSSVLTFEVEDAAIGRAMHAGGGIEVAEGVKVTVFSNTENSQVIASNAGDIIIAGEVEVNMMNQSPQASVALYGQNIEVTGKLTVNGGAYAMYVADQVKFNGADVKVTGSAVGVMQKAQITNSLIEMDTTMRAFGVAPDVSLTDEYAVFAGKDADDAVFIPHKNGEVAPESWFNTYVRIESHTCIYDRQNISEQYKATDATCTTAATYYYSCICGAQGTETFTGGEADASNHADLLKTEAKDATCTEDGNIEYWHCEACDKYFSDAECKTEISKAETVIKATGHEAEKTEAKDATCTETGNIEYWYCKACDKYFSDAECKTEISKTETVIKAIGHEAEKTEAKDATCTEDGNIAYWHCEACDKYFSDAECKTEISKAETVIKAIGHEAEKTEAKDATCTETGNIEYWYCKACDKYFSDAECKTEISKAETVVNAKGHAYEDGKCTVCGIVTADRQAADKVDALIDAIGSADEITLDSFDIIDAAAKAYNALTDEQKKLVTGYDDLMAAYEAYEALLAGGDDEEDKPGKPNETNPPAGNDDPADKDNEQKEDTDSPKTGDTTSALPFILLTLLSSGAVVVLERRKKSVK